MSHVGKRYNWKYADLWISIIVFVSNCPRFFGQSGDVNMGLASMAYSDLRQSFDIICLLYPDTQSVC